METTGHVPTKPLKTGPLIEEVTPKTMPMQVGDEGEDIARVQEHLTLRGHGTKVDGVFGPATKGAVKSFQNGEMFKRNESPEEVGIVGYPTWEVLIRPYKQAFEAGPTPPRHNAPTSFGEALRRTIQSHIDAHPREVDGQNEGPWVRGYMSGDDGAHLPWCAGFVTSLIYQACAWYGAEAPLSLERGVDQMMGEASEFGRVVESGELKAQFEKTQCPFVFCLIGGTHPNGQPDYTHTGFVMQVEEDHVVTAEGNTNDSGDREGYEACRRFRAADGLAFIDLRLDK